MPRASDHDCRRDVPIRANGWKPPGRCGRPEDRRARAMDHDGQAGCRVGIGPRSFTAPGSPRHVTQRRYATSCEGDDPRGAPRQRGQTPVRGVLHAHFPSHRKSRAKRRRFRSRAHPAEEAGAHSRGRGALGVQLIARWGVLDGAFDPRMQINPAVEREAHARAGVGLQVPGWATAVTKPDLIELSLSGTRQGKGQLPALLFSADAGSEPARGSFSTGDSGTDTYSEAWHLGDGSAARPLRFDTFAIGRQYYEAMVEAFVLIINYQNRSASFRPSRRRS